MAVDIDRSVAAQRANYGNKAYWDQFMGKVLAQAPPVTPLPQVTPTPAPAANPADDAIANVAAQTAARAAARARADDLVKQRGLDPTQYKDMLDKEFERVASSDPKAGFTDTIASSVLDGEQARLRSQFLQQADQKFGSDYGERTIASSLLDDTINSILGEQRGNAEQFLERGKARGIYNDVGYSAGRAALDSNAQVARSRLGSMASDVIDKYRGEANSIRDKAYGEASNYTLGRNLDLDRYFNQGSEIANRAQQFGGGDLRGTLGGTNFFDFSGLSGAVGQAQGAQNLRDTDVATALRERKRLGTQNRGLGSQGVF
jgi:hypothetical protein